MASARYWRLVGVRPYAGADLELGGIHWYVAGVRVDGASTLSCSHAPIAGSLSALNDGDAATTVRFASSAVRAGGFFLAWDFGSAVGDIYPVLYAAGRPEFLGWATLQYSSDAISWTTDLNFGRVIYPGVGLGTADNPVFREEVPSEWDAASAGAHGIINGREALVSNNFTGVVRTGAARVSGRRVFGLELTAVNPPQYFFGGLAALADWGTYTVGKHWTMYGLDGVFYYYPAGTTTSLSPAPGAFTSVGDKIYYDVDLDTGYCAIKKNAGAWSAAVLLPNFVVGAGYVIDLMAASSSGVQSGARLLTTIVELGAAIPVGASAWDSQLGESNFLEPSVLVPSAIRASVCASADGAAGSATIHSGALLARDAQFGGAGRIWGTTKAKGTPNTPTKARVVLLHQRSKLPVREVWSDPVTGYFEFRGIDTSQQFIVLAEDVDGNFRPVAANMLVPEVLP